MPVPSKAMKDFANAALVKPKVEKLIAGSASDRFKRLFDKEDKKKQEELVTRLDDLAQRILRNPDGKMLWFVKWYLTAFQNKVSEEAKAVFDILSETKEFKNMELAANTWRERQQKSAAVLSTECSKILGPLANDTNGVVALAKQLSELLTKTIPATAPAPAPAAPAATPAPTGTTPTLAGLKAQIQKNANVIIPLLNPAWRVTNLNNMRGDTLLRAIAAAYKIKNNKKVLGPVLKAAGLDPARLPQTLAESTNNKLKQHKAYYDLGLITENEYLAFLVETKKILSEQPGGAAPADPAAPAEPAQPTPQQIEQTKTWISGLTNDIRIVCEPLMTALSGLQQTTADMSKATGPVGRLSEQQEKAIKEAVKKTFSLEASKTETINEQLLLLGALVAALGAVFGWVKKKFAFPQGGTFWNGQGTVRVAQGSDQIQKDLQGLTRSAGSAEGPDNQEYDPSGKPVGNTEASKAGIIKALQDGQAQFAAIQNRATGLQTPDLSLALGIPNTNPSYAQINLLANSLGKAVTSVSIAELAKVIDTLRTGKI